VQTAVRDFALPFKPPTDSRVSLVTGLHRKEVARLRHGAVDLPPKVSAAGSIASRVIGRWMTMRSYRDARGRPRRIPYESRSARAPSFVRLVRDLGIDVPARSVLDELIRTGAVEMIDGSTLRLCAEVLVPAGDLSAKLPILASDPAELFATIAHNIDSSDDSWLQRKVVYDNIGADALPDLREAARVAGAEFIRAANELLASRDRDRNPRAPGGRRSRAVLAVYYFEADAEAEVEGESPRDAMASPAGRSKTKRSARGARTGTRARGTGADRQKTSARRRKPLIERST
jgi:hypothetical protein